MRSLLGLPSQWFCAWVQLGTLSGAQAVRNNMAPRRGNIPRAYAISCPVQPALRGAISVRCDAQCLQTVFGKKCLSLRQDRARPFERVAVSLAIV